MYQYYHLWACMFCIYVCVLCPDLLMVVGLNSCNLCTILQIPLGRFVLCRRGWNIPKVWCDGHIRNMDKIWTLRTIYHSVLVVHNFHQSIQIADICGKTAADSHHQAHHHCHGYSQKQLSTFLFIQIKQIKIIISILINFIIQKLFCIFLSHFAAYMWLRKLLPVIVLMLGVVMVECARSVIVLNLKQ